ncbi:hypothetical protein GKIL_1695 [Gloeobacter kilaueensis JS1]|uniref:Uncharacterized protein n=2 Tax=Gloeobacter TaxID=33071 RepID=U5QG95_GLOK1|nr:hypothetical protein GKIL_1695 [Gloeobacter kilaueensis JS1]
MIASRYSYEAAASAGHQAVAQNLQTVQQSPALLAEQGQTVIRAVGLGDPAASSLVANFDTEAACATSFVVLVQQQYSDYQAAGNSPLSTFGFPVTGTVNTVDAAGSAQSFAPDAQAVADFTAVGLLALSQSVQNTILVVHSSINTYQKISPPKP